MTTDTAAPQFEALLEFIKTNRGFDFTGYKRSSLQRRVEHRMRLVGIDSFADYTDYLEVHPDEFTALFNAILINVTAFFRDADAWEYVQHEVIPQILAAKGADEPIRVWSAACASGEEAYTLAILFAEALGAEQFRQRVKIYATDVDEEALVKARSGTYLARETANLPPHLLDKYFERFGERYIFLKELRRAVIFGRHDLIQDAPISRIDLLSCRNTMMYFNSETQARILARFNFALNDKGMLLLGKAETLLTHGGLFVPVDIRNRIFAKAGKASARERLLFAAQSGREETGGNSALTMHVRLRESAFEADPVAQLVVDSNGAVVLINERLRSAFRLQASDVGRPLQDLEISYRPVELRSLVQQAANQRQSVSLNEVRSAPDHGEVRWFDIQVVPLYTTGNMFLGTKILYKDVTETKLLRDELDVSRHALETAYEELQSTNEELQTTNEELQSTVEELETTNEELQSSNEELETMNEELQSTNEELETMNDELRERTAELNRLNGFLESILSSLQVGVIVVNREMVVEIWNYYVEDLWGVRQDEAIGKGLLTLDIGLRLGDLQQPLRNCLNGSLTEADLSIPAINRRGQHLRTKVRFTPLHGNGGTVDGVIVVVEATPTRHRRKAAPSATATVTEEGASDGSLKQPAADSGEVRAV